MNQQQARVQVGVPTKSADAPAPDHKGFSDNPLYDTEKMGTAVVMANQVTRSCARRDSFEALAIAGSRCSRIARACVYRADGVEIMSINIISALPNDDALTRSLASGAVASAEALQAETAARGQANAIKIQAEADADTQRINAKAAADAELIKAQGLADADRVRAEGTKASLTLRAEGEADGIRAIAAAIKADGGSDAMSQRIAEQCVVHHTAPFACPTVLCRDSRSFACAILCTLVWLCIFWHTDRIVPLSGAVQAATEHVGSLFRQVCIQFGYDGTGEQPRHRA